MSVTDGDWINPTIPEIFEIEPVLFVLILDKKIELFEQVDSIVELELRPIITPI